MQETTNNIDYAEIATMLAELYSDTVIEIGCERALKSHYTEEQSETN